MALWGNKREARRSIRESGRRYYLDLRSTVKGFRTNVNFQVQNSCDGIVTRAIRRCAPLVRVSSREDADLLVRIDVQLTGLSAQYQTAQGARVGVKSTGVRSSGRIEVFTNLVAEGGRSAVGVSPGFARSFSATVSPPPSVSSRGLYAGGASVEAAILKSLEPQLKRMSRKLWGRRVA